MNAVPGTVLDAGEAPENKTGKKKSSADTDHKQIKVYLSSAIKKNGTSLVVQWLRVWLAMQGTWVQSPVREPGSHMQQGS